MKLNSLGLLSLPLWILILAWQLMRRDSLVTEAELKEYDALLETLYYALPVPHGRAETWMVTQVVEWIQRERDAVTTARQLGVVLVGGLRS
jgi:hypothetical protein